MDYDAVLVLTTCSSTDEADKIATALTEKKAAACCNIVPGLHSIYFWQGKLAEDDEVLLLTKTTKAAFGRVKKIIKELHSYEVPEMIALPIVDGSEDYLTWIVDQTKAK